jgi:hypothetical protein
VRVLKFRDWQSIARLKVRDYLKHTDDDRRRIRITALYEDRRSMLGSIDDIVARSRALQRDKCLGQLVQAIGDPAPEWDRIFMPEGERYREYFDKYMGGTALVIHIGPPSGPSLCGTIKGRVADDPSVVTLIKDRWCSRCWNRWAKQRAA